MVNSALVRMLDWKSAEELVGRSLFSDIAADPKEFVRLLWRSRRTRVFRNVQMTWRRKDGCPLLFRVSGELLSNSQGRFCWIEGEVEDINQQARGESDWELLFMDSGLEETFRQQLVVILLRSERLLRKATLAAKEQERVERVLGAGTQARDDMRMGERILRASESEKKSVPLNRCLEGITAQFRPHLDPRVQWVHDLDAKVGAVMADEQQLRRMAMNLVNLALGAMPAGGTLTLRTRQTQVSMPATGLCERAPGIYWSFAVTDTGTRGPREPGKPRLVEDLVDEGPGKKKYRSPFAEVVRLAEENDGFVECHTMPGGGRACEVFLRCARPMVIEWRTERPREPLPTGCESILVVEPDPLLMQHICETLRAQGYEILPANSARELGWIVDHHPERIHLLIARLPIDKETADELLPRFETRPLLRALQIGEGDVAERSARQGVAVLEKPFLGWELVKKVQEILGESNVQ